MYQTVFTMEVVFVLNIFQEIRSVIVRHSSHALTTVSASLWRRSATESLIVGTIPTRMSGSAVHRVAAITTSSNATMENASTSSSSAAGKLNAEMERMILEGSFVVSFILRKFN